MKYNFVTGIERSKKRGRKFTAGVIASVIMVGGAAIPALAAGSADSQASPCGDVHGAFADQNGNFGFLGQEFQGAPNYHGGVMGQEPGATGYNNSHTNCQQQT